MANYLVLSLQMDKIRPTPVKVQDEKELEKMEKKLLRSMEKFGLTRLELFREIAVKCEDFIVFYRENSFGSDLGSWPQVCGELFYEVPIFTPFGACFTTNMTLRYWITFISLYFLNFLYSIKIKHFLLAEQVYTWSCVCVCLSVCL